MEHVLDQFKNTNKISLQTISKYKGEIPAEVLDLWVNYGEGTFFGGYFKVINPGDYVELLSEVYKTHHETVPLFLTAMGDIIICEKDRYLSLLNFRRGTKSIIAAGFDYFMEDLNDKSFAEEELDWHPYPEAVEAYGIPAFDECFGYIPLLGMGGNEKLEYLKKVMITEQIYFTAQMMGPIR